MAYVVCPNCQHKYSSDDMNAAIHDLWRLAVDEQAVEEKCPQCEESFWVKGGYTPHWDSATNVEEL